MTLMVAPSPARKRARKCEAPVRGMCRIVNEERFTAAIAGGHAFNFERQYLGDGHTSLQTRHAEFNRLEFDTPKIADQVGADHTGCASGFAADNS